MRGLGFADIVELDPGASHALGDVEVTAVPVRHSGTRGLGDYLRRGACGYVVRARAGGDQRQPPTWPATPATSRALRRSAAGFTPTSPCCPSPATSRPCFREEHLSPLDALYAFDDLGARLLIPTSYGSFPLSYERLDAPLAWLRDAGARTGLARPDGDRRLAILDHGETLHVRMHA